MAPLRKRVVTGEIVAAPGDAGKHVGVGDHKRRPPQVASTGGGRRSDRKPSFVPLACASGMVICLGRPSPVASSSLPAATARIPEGTGRGAVWVTPRRLTGL